MRTRVGGDDPVLPLREYWMDATRRRLPQFTDVPDPSRYLWQSQYAALCRDLGSALAK
jgi:hypothetical protein